MLFERCNPTFNRLNKEELLLQDRFASFRNIRHILLYFGQTYSLGFRGQTAQINNYGIEIQINIDRFCSNLQPNNYKTKKGKMDVDLQKFFPIPYKTT